MPERRPPLTPEVARATWDQAAEAYAALQDSGNDYYRTEFFGPVQLEVCGDVGGLEVLDLGCGNGYLSRELARRGARVTGVDLSPEMIRLAEEREAASPLGIDYELLDALAVGDRFGAERFDLVTACMSLQDMPDIPGVITATRQVLRSGGRFVTCNSHPFSDTPFREWFRDEAGEKRALIVGDYFEATTLEYEWAHERMLYPFKTQANHVTLQQWFEWVTAGGFAVRGLREPRPTDEALAARPELLDARLVPYFLILDLEKRS